MRVEHIPDSVFEMRNLKTLSITGMDCDYIILDDNGEEVKDCWMIREIPRRIKGLQELEHLELSLNAIAKIPKEIRGLKA